MCTKGGRCSEQGLQRGARAKEGFPAEIRRNRTNAVQPSWGPAPGLVPAQCLPQPPPAYSAPVMLASWLSLASSGHSLLLAVHFPCNSLSFLMSLHICSEVLSSQRHPPPMTLFMTGFPPATPTPSFSIPFSHDCLFFPYLFCYCLPFLLRMWVRRSQGSTDT